MEKQKQHFHVVLDNQNHRKYLNELLKKCSMPKQSLQFSLVWASSFGGLYLSLFVFLFSEVSQVFWYIV